MNEINNKELNERAAKLANRIGDVMVGEILIVCLHTLANVAATFLVSYTDTKIATVEDTAKLFYEDLLRSIKRIEQNIANNAKAN